MIQHFIVIATAIFSIVSLAIVLRLDHHGYLSISQHVALTKKSSIIFCITCLLTVALIAPFMLFWFIPHFHLSWLFQSLITLILIDIVIVGFFPHSRDLSAIFHQFASWGIMYAIFPLIIDLFVETYSVSNFATKLFTVLFLLYACTLVPLHKTKNFNKRILYYESTYTLGFFLILIMLTY